MIKISLLNNFFMMVNTSLKKVVDDKNHILEEVFDDVEDIFKTVTFW